MVGGAGLRRGAPSAEIPGCFPHRVQYADPLLDDSAWREVTLPPDWGIEGPFVIDEAPETGKRDCWGAAWYRKRWHVDPGVAGERIYLVLEGAMSEPLVWLNGQLLGGWPYGYASFQIDLSAHLCHGTENVIAIRIENRRDSSRWDPGAGIYRDVWLVRTGPIHVGLWGLAVSARSIAGDCARVSTRVRVENHRADRSRVYLRIDIYSLDAHGRRSTSPVAVSRPAWLVVEAGGEGIAELFADVNQPRRWATDEPCLYLAVAVVRRAEELLDRYEVRFGIREAKWDARRGFLLNSRPLELRGVCLHHDLGALGAAFNRSAAERRLRLLRDMGANAIRTSHNPPAPGFLDLCDEMGFVVIDEIFDCWSRGKRSNDYGRWFSEWHEADLRAWVRRDRNHPCVIAWSIGNEVAEQNSPAGLELVSRMRRIVGEEDPTRPVTAACDNVKAGFNGFQTRVDVFGFNYKPGVYAGFRAENPDVPLYGAETASTVSTRGHYRFDDDGAGSTGDLVFQVSSYDREAPLWGTLPDVEFDAQDRTPGIAGEFVWTGFDYLGEPTPFNPAATTELNLPANLPSEKSVTRLPEGLPLAAIPARSSYFGIIDLAGFPKDRFFLYRSRWRPDLPCAHIVPHWTWPGREGHITPVQVYASGDEAELFLNGRSLGVRRKAAGWYRFCWDRVVFEPGELKVVVYKAGEVWAEGSVGTAGPASVIRLAADRDELACAGTDLAFVAVTLVDDAGRVDPHAAHELHFTVEGPGEIVATDNGDPTDLTAFQSFNRRAFHGHALAILCARAAGAIRVTASAESLLAGVIVLNVR